MPRPCRVVVSFVVRLLIVAGLVVPTLSAGASTSVPWPAKPRLFQRAIEQYAPYHPQTLCLPHVRAGTKALGDLLVRTYSRTSYVTVRPCGAVGKPTSATSEHYDGRALDWMVSAHNATQKADAETFINWLLADDRWGNHAAMMRRLGIMYVIWDNQMWGSWDQQWHPYLNCAAHPEVAYDDTCHRTHMHISLTWLGALERTSFWQYRVAVWPLSP